MRPAASPARRMFCAAAPAAVGLAATAGLGLAWGLAEAEARTVRTHR
ncbi:metallophosphoesterase, partial [Xanthomonas citri pv. citri]|nr:metallophosphoesterase [Xanthomonas citri pv. citri]